MGPPERDKTYGPQGVNDGWVRRPLGDPTEYFDNPVRAGFDQFLVQPHLEFCRAYKAKTHLKDRDSPQVVLRVYFASFDAVVGSI